MKDNKGSVLLYSLFLMLTLSATAMMTAFVILVNTRSTANSTKSISAYYAAESGIEEGLYAIKDDRFSKTIVDTALLHATISKTTLSNSAQFATTAVNNYKTELIFDLPALTSKQIDFSNPDTGDDLISSPGTINLSWEKDGACVEDGALELSIRSYDSATWDDESAVGSEVLVLPCGTSCSTTAALSASLGHKIRLKSLYCDLNNVTISVTADSSLVAFPNYVKIESVGEMGNTSYPLQAEVIWKPSLSGLGDYVIFSEALITK